MKKYGIGVFGILLSLSAACDLCRKCGNREVSRLVSPDEKLEAVIFEFDCGATTDFTTQISIVPKGGSLLSCQGGNTFAASSDREAPRATWGVPPANVKWLSNRHVLISFHPTARIGLRQPSVSIRTGMLSHEQVVVEYLASLQ